MRRYNCTFFLVAMLLLGMVLGVNSLVDTYWYFGTTNLLSTCKFNFDERVQKTNLLLNMPPRYDALLLGSSRVSFMPPALFRGSTLFNYSLGSMYPDEYEECVAAARLRHPVRTIYIGMDFYGTATHKMFPADNPVRKNVEGAQNPLRKLGALLSWDGLLYAFRTARMSLGGGISSDYYDKDYVKHMAPYSREQQPDVILAQLRLYHEKAYGPGYQWNGALPELYRRLRQQNPDVEFVVFTTPISAPMFSLLVRDGRLHDYERWLRLIVENFGSVQDFMGLNSVTENLDNYADAHHYLPPVGEYIVDRLEGRNTQAPADFGVRVTSRNLDEHLAQIRLLTQRTDPDPFGTWEAKAKVPAGSAKPTAD